MTLGDRILAARKAADLTQAQVAQKLRCYPSTISNWEQGVSEPHIATLIALARVLRTTASELLGE